MAAGQAQHLFAQQPDLGPVTICDIAGRPRWQPLWAGNPAIRVPTFTPQGPTIRTGGGCLPYLKYPYDVETGWQFTDWKARDHRGSIYLTEAESVMALSLVQKIGPYILVEPPGSDRKNPNRSWPIASWRAFVRLLQSSQSLPVIQLDHPTADRLPGVTLIQHDDFRQACAILSMATFAVLPEGGLAHAAAALSVPAVVMFGGCISVDALGYPEHVNLEYFHPRTPCGSLKPCVHCAEGWAKLTPDIVMEALKDVPAKVAA